MIIKAAYRDRKYSNSTDVNKIQLIDRSLTDDHRVLNVNVDPMAMANTRVADVYKGPDLMFFVFIYGRQ